MTKDTKDTNNHARIIVNFPATGAADPLNIEAEGLTDGQMISAGFYLVAMSLYKILKNMGFQDQEDAKKQARDAQEIAMVQSLGMKLDRKKH
jgi:hypothetical protein